jgi:hypothetical protein
LRPATRAALGMLTIAALLVPVLASASWDPLFRGYLTFAEGEVTAQGRFGIASASAIGDFNGDGLPDIAVTNRVSAAAGTGRTISVLLHSGSANYPPMYEPWNTVTATDAGATPIDIAVADLNGDGKKDILTSNYVGGSPHSLSVLYGLGGGLFRPYMTKLPPNYAGGMRVAELNNDGRADVAYFANLGGGNYGVAVMYSTPDSLGPAVTYGSSAGLNGFGIGDATSDGIPDIILTYANSMQILVGDNAGAFSPDVNPTPFGSPGGASMVNVNGDAFLDIVEFNSAEFKAVILMGLGFGTFQSPVTVSLGPVLPGERNMLTGDVDADGHVDLVGFSNRSSDIAVLRNNGTGSFGSATHYACASYTGVPALADVNQDGWPDLVAGDDVGDAGNSVAVLLNDGAGGFQSAFKSLNAIGPVQEALGDFNRDGRLDVAVADSLRITLGLGNGDGTFASSGFVSTSFSPTRMVTADINRDGKLDLLAQIGTDIAIYLGAGDLTFSLSQTLIGASLLARSVADMDRNGRPDLIVGNTSMTQLKIYFQQSDGTYSTSTTYSPAVGLNSASVGDWNRDGFMDVAVAGPSGLSVYPGSTAIPGTLGAEAIVASGTAYADVCAMDFNRDGMPDLAGRLRFANASATTGINLFAGSGSGGFGAAVPYGLTASSGLSIDSWDANRDGVSDLVTTGISSQAFGGNAHAEVLLGGTNGTFALRTGYGLGLPVTKPSFGDLNGDAMPDIISAYYTEDSDAPGQEARSIERTILALPPTKLATLRPVTRFSGLTPGFVAVGDVNRDGKPDVVTGNYSTSPGIGVLLGNGSGGLGASTALSQSRYGGKIALADFNRDGILDIAALDVSVGSERIATFLGVGDGTFGARTDFVMLPGFDFEIGDMNRDGIPDIVTTTASGPSASVRVLLGTGLGTFTSGSTVSLGGATAYDLDLADLDRDGDLDVVLAAGAGAVKVIYNGPTGVLAAPVTLSAPLTDCQNVVVADISRDGVPDIVATDGPNYYVIWGSLSAPPSTYTSANLGYGALELKVGEAAADGKPYLFLTRNADGLEVFSVSPGGAFTHVDSQQPGTAPVQLALADMDRDGQVDVVSVAFNAFVTVNLHGYASGVTAVETPAPPAPPAPRVALQQNYPNPFNPHTTIRYSLARSERVQLRVFDVRGRLVTTLRDGSEPAGERRVEWDGRDREGQPVASGVYIYRLTTDSGDAKSRRMAVLK